MLNTEEIANRQRAEERDRLLRRGIPAKDAEAILADSLQSTKALEAARSFLADSDARMLILSGPVGVGKTTAASWTIAQESPDRFLDPPCQWYLNRSAERDWPGNLHPRLIEANRLARQSTFDEQAMDTLERCSMLAVDDLGHEYVDGKGWLRSLLDGLVNRRYAGLRRTIITTNLNGSEFRARYGERIADRVRESGRFVELKGESLRRRTA